MFELENIGLLHRIGADRDRGWEVGDEGSEV